MTTHSPTPAALISPPPAVPLLAWMAATIALLAAFFLLQENGVMLSGEAAAWLHEVTHDGRHALGVPCH